MSALKGKVRKAVIISNNSSVRSFHMDDNYSYRNGRKVRAKLEAVSPSIPDDIFDAIIRSSNYQLDENIHLLKATSPTKTSHLSTLESESKSSTPTTSQT